MAKKFNVNVAESWISTDIQNASQPAETASPVEVKENTPKQTEKKTVAVKDTKKSKTVSEKTAFVIEGKELKKRQTSILLKESIYAKLENLSKKNNISINSCINQILEQVLA